jgi:hypothetical protein
MGGADSGDSRCPGYEPFFFAANFFVAIAYRNISINPFEISL